MLGLGVWEPVAQKRRGQRRVAAYVPSSSRGPVHNQVETSAVIGLYVGSCGAGEPC